MVQVKSLRLQKHWSQEQLAQFSGLNVRTIQRVEKGESVGSETLKSLAAVFEITTDELTSAIQNDMRPSLEEGTGTSEKLSQKSKAKEKVRHIRYFYTFSAFLIAVFLVFMLPNYNQGENLGPLITLFLSFSVLIAGLAVFVFQPFGEEWEKAKIARITRQQNEVDPSNSEH
ncbi:helix-turn-helix domain-containing protein [Pseudidiomarina sp. 1ASP75-5]|nr:helix-turn-helix domain-containing protein [Pseudidiomarina sp. 1APR75-33.1]MDN7135777.1 helix-turn-helix domain-containing protein [Pseudidiomarina sp. 1ASP75-5]